MSPWLRGRLRRCSRCGTAVTVAPPPPREAYESHLDLPRHRTHFTPAGLRALLERHGFAVELEQHALLEHNPFGLWQTIVNRFTTTPSWLFNALKRDAPLVHRDALVTLVLLPFAPLCLLAERAFAALGRGGTIAVVARLDV